MKKVFLNFNPKGYAPKIISRRLRISDVVGRSVCYKEDGGTDPDPEAEKAALLEKIKANVKSEIETRGYTNAAAVQKIFDTTLEGVKLEALRAFDFEKVGQSVKNMAEAIEKLQNAPAPGEQKRNAFKELFAHKETMEMIERSFKEGGREVVLNVRAAVTAMTTGNVVNDGDIPEDILNSFSVDSFIKKRRPMEYLFDLVNRRTVPAITEYKTWIEEGDEEGAFAIVSEGAVKPLVSKTLIRNTSKYKKVAGKRVYTEEFTKFRKEAYSILEDLFNDQLMRNYIALLTIDVLAVAAAYTGTILDAQYTNPTDYHAIGAVAAQIEGLDFMPDTLFLNPQDKWRIGLSVDDNNRFYVGIPTYNPSGEVQMLGFRLVTSNRMPVGNFILGESRLYKVEDEPVKVRLGYGINVTKDGANVTDVTSDVDTNRFRIIAETYFHSYIGTAHTGSFVYGNFADIKEALLKPAV